jgi:hypothetical protein
MPTEKMPLNADAPQLIRKNLKEIAKGNKVRAVSIGYLTEKQLLALNTDRESRNFPPMIAEVLFVGAHAYDSRVIRDGYTIEDVIDQIVSAMSEHSVIEIRPKMSSMTNPRSREDRYGNRVKDKAVFECSVRHPRAELLSVYATGARVKPKDLDQKQTGHIAVARSPDSKS